MDIVAKHVRFYKLNNVGEVVHKFRGLVSLGDFGMSKDSIDTDDFDKKYKTTTGGKTKIDAMDITTKVDTISHNVVVSDFANDVEGWYGLEYPDGIKELSCKLKGNIMNFKDTGFSSNGLINTTFNIEYNDFDSWTPPEYVEVKGLTLTDVEPVMLSEIGATSVVEYTLAPDNVTDKGVFVGTDNNKVATVKVVEGGIEVTAVGEGTTRVDIVTADGGFVANVNVTVSEIVG